ncbi:MAG TPA: hypothetical protein VFH00_01610 [Candidatus Nitrosotalea sp.]|nr:hypothetical protein [Candidatus Nitrosotalea sp.]
MPVVGLSGIVLPAAAILFGATAVLQLLSPVLPWSARQRACSEAARQISSQAWRYAIKLPPPYDGERDMSAGQFGDASNNVLRSLHGLPPWAMEPVRPTQTMDDLRGTAPENQRERYIGRLNSELARLTGQVERSTTWIQALQAATLLLLTAGIVLAVVQIMGAIPLNLVEIVSAGLGALATLSQLGRFEDVNRSASQLQAYVARRITEAELLVPGGQPWFYLVTAVEQRLAHD